MDDPSLIPIKDAISSLGLSRTTLYERLKKQDIHPIKIKGKAYLSLSDLSRITEQGYSNTLSEEQAQYQELKEQLSRITGQLEQLTQENENIKKENKQLTLLLGEERGRASAYQEHIKQLTDQSKDNSNRHWWQFWK